MVEITETASGQVDDLVGYYARKGRGNAIAKLRAALHEAQSSIAAKPDAGAKFPSTYDELADRGLWWVRSGDYWFAYAKPTSCGQNITITNVFYLTADIPARL